MKELDFIEWLKNRLINLHGYACNSDIITGLESISIKLKPTQYKTSINDTNLDNIIVKYFIDFNMDKTEDLKIGYTKNERENLRSIVRSVVDDIVNFKHGI